MATPTLTTDLVTLAIGQLADSGSWTSGNEKSSAYWTEGQIEGSEVIAYILNSATVDYEYGFEPTTATNIGTSSVLRMWHNCIDAFRCDTKALKGLAAYIIDNSNTYYWYLFGGDTIADYSGGWFQSVVDTSLAASEGGTPAWTSVSMMGFTNYKTAAGKNTETAFIDAIRYGNNIYARGGTSGDEIDIDGIFLLDYASAYGILSQDSKSGVYVIRGAVNIGDTASTNSTYFLTEGVVIIAEDLPYVSTDTLQLNFGGNTTGTTDIQLLGCFIGAAGVQLNISCDDTDITDLEFNGNTFQNIAGLKHKTGDTIQNNVYNDCFRVDPQNANFTNNTFLNCTDTDGAMIWDTTTANTESCAFNNCTLGVYIPATVTGSITMDAMMFSGNTTDVYWAGTAGELTINTSNATNITVTGSAGGTVTVVSGVNFKFTVSPSITDYEWRIYSVTAVGSMAGSVELDGEETATSDNQTYSYQYVSDTPIAVQIISQPDEDYIESVTYYTLSSLDQDINILLTKEDNK